MCQRPITLPEPILEFIPLVYINNQGGTGLVGTSGLVYEVVVEERKLTWRSIGRRPSDHDERVLDVLSEGQLGIDGRLHVDEYEFTDDEIEVPKANLEVVQREMAQSLYSLIVRRWGRSPSYGASRSSQGVAWFSFHRTRQLPLW